MSVNKELRQNEAVISKLTEARSIKPVVTHKGVDLYTFSDAVQISEAKILGRTMGAPADAELGVRQLNPSGETYPRSKKGAAAIDPGLFFNNRYRKTIKQPNNSKRIAIYEIVTDSNVLQRVESGQMINDNILVYVVTVSKGTDEDPEAMNYVLTETKVIDSPEFSREFKKKLKMDSMKIIMNAIGKSGHNIGLTADDLTI